MRVLRTTILTRILTTLLIGSVVAVMLVPSAWAQRNDVAASYEVWLRQQLRVTPDAHMEAALAEALEERPASLEDFLYAFVAAYEAEADVSLSEAFALHAPSDEALISYLHGRYLGIVGDAVMPRIVPMGVVAQSNTSNDRSGTARAMMTKRWLAWEQQEAAHLDLQAIPVIIPLRVLFSASPMGP